MSDPLAQPSPAAPEPAAGAPSPSWGLGDVVRELRVARQGFEDAVPQRPGHAALPSREALVRIVAGLRAALFPAHFGPAELSDEGADFFVGQTLDRTLVALREQIRRALHFRAAGGADPPRALTPREAEARATELTRAFARALPGVRAALESDVRAAFAGDPAATSIDETLFCYPGVTAITHHRLAHPLYRLGVPLVPRMIAEVAHADTGIDIHPGAQIGASFFIDHGTGVVIGETCEIGQRVRIYQGVTLGAKSFPVDAEGNLLKGHPRHPVVEDDVVIYSGATILGRITIGAGSSIGGNVWLTRSVAPHSRVTQAQARSDAYDGGGGI